MTRRPRAWRLATAALTALGLSVILAACGQSQGASTSSTPSSSDAQASSAAGATPAVDTANTAG